MVRPARPDDADALLELQIRGWQEGFAGIVDDAVIEAARQIIEEGSRGMEDRMRAIGARRVVAELEDEPVGFASFGPTRDQDEPATTGELMALFVDPPVWGKGVADALVERTLAELAADGFAEVTLWTFRDNQHADRLYDRHGFAPDGTEQRREPFGETPIVRLRRPLMGNYTF